MTKSDYAGRFGAPAVTARPEVRSTVGGDETREFVSESSQNYKSHGFAKRNAAIPAHTMHVSGEQFVGESTTKGDYQRWSSRPAESVKPQHTQAPAGPETRDFATESSKFNAKGFVARQPAIPFTSHVFDNTETRDFETEHARHFQSPPAAEACPSDKLVRQAAAQRTQQGGGSPTTHVVKGHHMYANRGGGRFEPVQKPAVPGQIRF